MLVPIVVCEVLFWVMLVLGLLARYVAGRKALSAVMLASTPLVDVVLIVITTIDLHRGADPHFTHGLSAFYIGFSIMLDRALFDGQTSAQHSDVGKVPNKPRPAEPEPMKCPTSGQSGDEPSPLPQSLLWCSVAG